MKSVVPLWHLVVGESHETGFKGVGSAVLVDAGRGSHVLLTASHVVDGRASIEVWFPFSKVRPVLMADRLEEDPDLDFAVFCLRQAPPTDARALRVVPLGSSELSAVGWVAASFNSKDVIKKSRWPVCTSAEGSFGHPLGNGLMDARAAEGAVKQGASGSALYLPEYGGMGGLIIQADNGPPTAIRLITAQAIQASLATATLRVGFSLKSCETHERDRWLTKLGCSPTVDLTGHAAQLNEGDIQFRGRRVALNSLVDYISVGRRRRPLTVTGSPGSGKSALVCRLLVGLDDSITEHESANGLLLMGVVPVVLGAYSLTGRTFPAAASLLGVSLGVPGAAVDTNFAALCSSVTFLRNPTGVNYLGVLIFDALDEMTSKEEALAFARLLRTLAEQAPANVRIVVATRRGSRSGVDGRYDLLESLGAGDGSPTVVDLDDNRYVDLDAVRDHVDHVLATLGTAYSRKSSRARVALRIASLAGSNFLVADLLARTRAIEDERPSPIVGPGTTIDLKDAFEDYLKALDGRPGLEGTSNLLSALSFADPPGFDDELWSKVSACLGTSVSIERISQIRRTEAANYLIETVGLDGKGSAYIFHDALTQYLRGRLSGTSLLAPTSIRDCERRVYDVIAGVLHDETSSDLSRLYSLAGMVRHALRANCIDVLLRDTEYLRTAGADVLRSAVRAGMRSPASDRAQVLRLALSPEATRVPRDTALRLAAEQVGASRLASELGEPKAPWARLCRVEAPQDVAAMLGHKLQVRAVTTFNVGGGAPRVASGGDDQLVRIWDPHTEQLVSTGPGHDARIEHLATIQDTDGHPVLGSCDAQGRIGIWNGETGESVNWLEASNSDSGNIIALAASEGQLLVAHGNTAGKVRCWKVGDGLQVWAQQLTAGVSAVASNPATPGSNCLFVGTDSGQVYVFDWQSGTQRCSFQSHQGRVVALSAYTTSSGIERIVSAGDDNLIRVWNADIEELVSHRPLDSLSVDSRVRAVCVGQDPKAGTDFVASVDESKSVRIMALASLGDPPIELRGHTGEVLDIASYWSGEDDAPTYVTGSGDRSVRLWDSRVNRPTVDPDAHRDWVRGVASASSLNGEHVLITVSADCSIRVWNSTDGEFIDSINGAHDDWIRCVCEVSPGYFATASRDASVKLWELSSRMPLHTFRGHSDGVWALGSLRTVDGKRYLASSGDDRSLRVWSVDERRQVSLSQFDEQCKALATHADATGDLVAVGSEDHMIYMVDPRSGTVVDQLKGHDGPVRALTFVGDTGVLASTGDDGQLRSWIDGTCVRSVKAHSNTARAMGLARRHDGSYLIATGSADYTVKLWEPESLELVSEIPVFSIADSVAPGPNPGELVIGSAHGWQLLMVDDPQMHTKGH
jgi:WD40 repeat protein